jgi:hypothetical protein
MLISKHVDSIEHGSELLPVTIYFRLEEDVFQDEECEPDYDSYHALLVVDCFCTERDIMSSASVSVQLPIEGEVDLGEIAEEAMLLERALEKLFVELAHTEEEVINKEIVA